MRITRAVIAAALTLTMAVVAQAGQPAAAITSTYTAVTGTANPVTGGLPIAYDPSNSLINASGTASSIHFDVTPTGSTDVLSVEIAPPTDGPLVTDTQMTTGDAAGPGVAQLEFDSGCAATGTLTILELATDGGGNITAFAADYTYTCDGQATVSGSLRYQSTQGYNAVLRNELNWDYGTELLKTNGIAKSFVFTNRGSGPETFSGIKVNQPKATFSVIKDTCTGTSVAPLATCRVTVMPHPRTLISSTGVPETGVLVIQPAGLPIVRVPLRVEGSDEPAAYVEAGPGRITVYWNQLPAPQDVNITGFQVYRGTSKTNLTKIRSVSYDRWKAVDTGVTAGRTYYYQVRPMVAGSKGDLTPVMAAIAWPKYSSGMYHRLPNTTRFTADHVVRTGQPFGLKILGQHGVPGSGVSAVALNLTAGRSSATTSLRVYPTGAGQPKPADLNLTPGRTRTNLVIAKIGRHGMVSIATAHGSVRVTVDVSGYFSGAALSHSYGMGGALQEYAYPGTIMDTKAYGIGAIKHDYFVNAPVNFRPTVTPHVTSLLVEVTAYGSAGSGTITGFATDRRPGGTSVLSYSPNTWTSNTAIIRAGSWYSSYDGNYYPSVSFLNRGAKPVQLIVSILGFFDDNYFELGARYTPTAPVHILGRTMHSDSTLKFNPGRYANLWTSTFNAKVTATGATRTTSLAIRAVGGGAAPSHGQVHVPAHVTVTGTTLPPTGVNNEMAIHNAAGTVTVNIWSFGRFNAYPIPLNTPGYATGTSPSVSTLSTPLSTSATRSTAWSAPSSTFGTAAWSARPRGILTAARAMPVR